MSTLSKILVSAVIAGAIVAGVAFFVKENSSQSVAQGTSSSGNVYNTAKFAGKVANLASPGANGTSTSILNTDATDRYVTGLRIGCEGVGSSKTAYTGAGLAALTITVATSSTAAPATLSPWAAITVGFTIPTSTPAYVLASSTPQLATSTWPAIWPTNTNMTFQTNATNTGVCTFGVDYIGS